MKDIVSVYARFQQIRALLTPIEDIEEKLCTEVVVTEISGGDSSKLRQDLKLAKKWYECGLRYYDAASYDLDRLVEDQYDGTIPAWVR